MFILLVRITSKSPTIQYIDNCQDAKPINILPKTLVKPTLAINL